MVFGLTGCVDLDPALMGGGYGPSYGPGYSRPQPNYGGGYYGRPDYDNHAHYDNHSHSDYRDRPSSNDNNYFGGPRAWYDAGRGVGKQDKHKHVSPNYRRHSSQFDGKTEREFARGYNDGYSGR